MSRPNPSIIPSIHLATLRQLLAGRLPGQLIIQLTDQCNASCIQCGMRRENSFQRSTIEVDRIRRMLDSAAANGVQAVSITGGEPLMYLKELRQCIDHAAALGIPYIRTGSNGFFFRDPSRRGFLDRVKRVADRLAESALYTFWISLDSACDRVHEENRGLPGMVEGIERGLGVFHERGLYPSANLGINRYLGGADEPPDARQDPSAFYRHFRHAFRAFYRRAEQLGFTIANACYPMSMDEEGSASVYTATSSDRFVRFSDEEKLALFQAMYDTIPEFRHRLRIFTPRSSLQTLIDQYGGELDRAYPCRGGIDYFFVDARDRNTYPCGFRGNENLGPFEALDLSAIDEKPWCKACDWECFRDPSQLLGPFADLSRQPGRLIKGLLSHDARARTWREDLRYYRACDYFNGRVAPDPARLARFAPPPQDAAAWHLAPDET